MMTILHPKAKLVWLLLLCTLAGACSKDDNDNPNPGPAPEPTVAELIIGQWYVIKITKPDGSTYVPGNDCEQQSNFEFKQDKTVDAEDYVVNAGVCEGTTQTGAYDLTMDGKKVLITQEGTTSILEILTLNADTLELKSASGRIYLLEK